jgi:hypothetical protein
MLVFVVVKNVRAGLRMFSDDEFLPGLAIAGAKARLLFCVFGTAKAMPCYKAKTAGCTFVNLRVNEAAFVVVKTCEPD